MTERLSERGITASALQPRVIISIEPQGALPPALRFILPAVELFSGPPPGVAAPRFPAAHPAVAGAAGWFYADRCPARPNPHAAGAEFRERLWQPPA